MKLFSLLLLLPILLMFSACDVSQQDYAPDNTWCKFYGTCSKSKTAACSVYGNCPAQKKKDRGCNIWGCNDSDTDDGEDGDVGCSVYGNCEEDDDAGCSLYGNCEDDEEDVGCSLYGNCDDDSSEDVGCSLYGRCDDKKSNGWW